MCKVSQVGSKQCSAVCSLTGNQPPAPAGRQAGLCNPQQLNQAGKLHACNVLPCSLQLRSSGVQRRQNRTKRCRTVSPVHIHPGPEAVVAATGARLRPVRGAPVRVLRANAQPRNDPPENSDPAIHPSGGRYRAGDREQTHGNLSRGRIRIRGNIAGAPSPAPPGASRSPSRYVGAG